MQIGGVYFADDFSPVQTSSRSSFTAVYLLFTVSADLFVPSCKIKHYSFINSHLFCQIIQN